MDRPGGLAAIGDTPVVRLCRLVEPGVIEYLAGELYT
jgi:hypothetical protein